MNVLAPCGSKTENYNTTQHWFALSLDQTSAEPPCTTTTTKRIPKERLLFSHFQASSILLVSSELILLHSFSQMIFLYRWQHRFINTWT